MDFVKNIKDINIKTVPEPNKRNLQLVYTPQLDEEMQNYTFLMSTLYPLNGQTDYHIHPVDEMIVILSGWGEAIIEDEKFDLEPGTVLYAKTGVKHQCKNYSAESMKMACFYIPALPDDIVAKMQNS